LSLPLTVSARAGDIVYDILWFLALVDPSVKFYDDTPLIENHGREFRMVCTALPRGAVETNVWIRAYFVFFNDLRPKPAGQFPKN
jgi:hypothetical protein